MRSDLFQHELTNTSAVFGRKSEVQVVFEGDGAKTDHKTIWLPSLPKGAEIGKREQGIFRGYTDHEAGHIRHTDRAALEAAMPKFQANPRLHSVWNALEDVWLERRVIAEYPGAVENLRETAKAVDEKALKDIPASDPRWQDDRFVGAVALTWEGRKDYGHGTGGKCLERVSAKLREQLPVWIGALDACNNTQDVLDLAEMIHGEIVSGKYTKPTEPGRGGKKGGSKGEGKGAPTEGDVSEGEADGDGGDEVEVSEEGGDGEASRGHGGTGCGDRDDVKDTYGARPDPGVYDGFDLDKVVRNEAARIAAAEGKGAYRPWSTRFDKVHTRFDEAGKYGDYTYGSTMRSIAEEHPNLYQRRIERAAGQINVVRRKLERVLLSQQNRGWEGGHEFGKLDSRRLVGAYRADPKVYKAREPVAELDTAVTLLVDLSGSMCGYEADLATDVIVVLSEVLAKVNIPFEVTGFNSRSNAPGEGEDWRLAYRSHAKTYARFEPIDIYVFKAFDERFAEAKPIIGQIAEHAGGNNVDGEALMMVYPRLAKRSERRKVLMVLSDGAPACVTNMDHLLAKHLKDTVKHIAKTGVECIGIGIATEQVKHYYLRNVVVNDLADLGNRAIEQLAKVLVGERYVVDNAALMKGAA